MELNLYGVSSIKLDKMRKRDLRKFIGAWAVIYLLTILAMSRLPDVFTEIKYQDQSRLSYDQGEVNFTSCDLIHFSETDFV